MKLGMNWKQTYEKFAHVQPPFVAYRDASYGNCTYKCELKHCLRGVEHAIKAKLFNLATFDIKNYEFYEKIQNGDMNWIIPNKILAFSTPLPSKKTSDGVG